MFTRSVALGLLASTVSAFDASASNNVAMYWGQGNAQISLTELCNDPSVDIVNMAFVNQFPKRRGEYPATNFGNACDDVFYTDEFGNLSGLRSSCPSIPEGIQTCRNNGKKVLLSIGGGFPIDYYLETQDIAEYLADFLWGAFGPPDDEWKAQNKPRPFGDQYVDGFDLDLEALMDPAPFDGYLSANYHYLVSRWKNVLFPSKAGDFYISSAPQCIVPDSRLADAISQSHFDFVFAQFYNTALCNARTGYEGITADATAFTFDAWVDWLQLHSTVNPNVKLYLGLPADKLAAPSDTSAYLEPFEANEVITHYKNKYPDTFGGVMLWEATYNVKNTCSGTTYSTNIKAILQGSYQPEVCPTPTSSSIASTSSAVVTPTAISLDGTCGSKSGYTCAGSAFGGCCSQYNYCGSSEIYCGAANCNPVFGNCGISSSSSVAPTTTSGAVGSSSSVVSSSTSLVTPTSNVFSSSSIPLSTGPASIVTPSVSVPFPNGNSTSAPFPTGTGVSIVTTVPVGTGASSIISSSASAPFPTGNSTTGRPSGTGVSIVTPVPIGTGASSVIHQSGTGSDAVSAPTGASSSIISRPSAPYPIVNGSHSAYPTAASSTTEYRYPVYTGPGYVVHTSKADEGYPAKSSQGNGYSVSKPSVTSKPGYAASSPAAAKTTCYTTTYVDICPTGLTTITATITKTYTGVAPKPTSNEIPEGWYTTVTVCDHCGPKTTTVTLTKPYQTPTEAAYHTPSSPAGQSAGKGGYSAAQPSKVGHPSSAAYTPGTFAGEETVSVTSKVYITVVPVPASEVPGYSAAATLAPYVPVNGTAAYVLSGTASSTGKGAAAYTGAPVSPYKPTLYEGAASRFSVGMSGLLVLAAGALLV